MNGKDSAMEAVSGGEAPRLERAELLDAGWLNKFRLHFSLPGGGEHSYEAVSRKPEAEYLEELAGFGQGVEVPADEADAVCIVGVTKEGSFVLTREFRMPVNAWTIAFPAAGLFDARHFG